MFLKANYLHKKIVNISFHLAKKNIYVVADRLENYYFHIADACRVADYTKTNHGMQKIHKWMKKIEYKMGKTVKNRIKLKS